MSYLPIMNHSKFLFLLKKPFVVVLKRFISKSLKKLIYVNFIFSNLNCDYQENFHLNIVKTSFKTVFELFNFVKTPKINSLYIR